MPVTGVAERAAAPFAQRGEALLHEVLRANGVDGLALEWSWLGNRAALSLINQGIRLDIDHVVAFKPVP